MYLYKKSKKNYKGFIIRIIILVVIIISFVMLIIYIEKDAKKNELFLIENAIEKAIINCYAVDGEYPTSIDYLIENYGIVIDEERFDVYLEKIDVGIFPKVTIIENQEGGEENE